MKKHILSLIIGCSVSATLFLGALGIATRETEKLKFEIKECTTRIQAVEAHYDAMRKIETDTIIVQTTITLPQIKIYNFPK